MSTAGPSGFMSFEKADTSCTRTPIVPPGLDCACVGVDADGGLIVDGVPYSPPAASAKCSEVIACLVPGSVPVAALAGPGNLPAGVAVPVAAIAGPGNLPAGVTVPASQVTGPLPVGQIAGPGAIGPGITLPADQLSGVIPAANLPPTTHTSSWDPIGNIYTDTVNGVTTTTNFGSLDDEGVTLGIVGGVLQLKNKAGAVIGSTPIIDKDDQTLSIVPSAADITIKLVNGGSVSFTCKDIYTLFASDPAVPSLGVELLGNDCKKHSIKAIGEAIRVGFNLASGPITATVDPLTGAVVINAGGVTSPPFTPIVTPGNIKGPGAIGSGITLPANQLTGVIPAANLPPVSCPQVIGCLVPGSVPANALAPGAIGSGVTLPANQLTGVIPAANLPPTVHSMAVSGTGAARVLSHTINGVTASVPVADLDQQQLSISGNVVSLTNGGSVTIPTNPPAPTTHTNTWTQAGGLAESVNGVPSNIAIPQGVITNTIGYNATGAPVWQPATPAIVIRETGVFVAGGASVPTQYVGPTPINPYINEFLVRSLFVVDGANSTIVLTPPTPALAAQIGGVEFDIKTLGAWAGPVTIAPSGGATIDGAASLVFTKTATTQPSRSVRWVASTNNWVVV